MTEIVNEGCNYRLHVTKIIFEVIILHIQFSFTDFKHRTYTSNH